MDPADGAPEADRGRWPVVRTPSRRWTVAWRAVALLVGAGLIIMVAVRVALAPVSPADVARIVLNGGVVVWCAVVMWRWAPRPRLPRGEARRMAPGFGPLREEKLHTRMRREIVRPGPLAPELRRPAAVRVALHTRQQPWTAALAGGLLAAPLVGWLVAGSDPTYPDLSTTVLGLLFVIQLVARLAPDVRVVRAATAAGAVPRAAAPDPVTPAAGPPPRP